MTGLSAGKASAAAAREPKNAGPPAKDLNGREIGCFWDPEARFTHTLLLAFEHWCVGTSVQQHTLGTCVILSRHDVRHLWELPGEALRELADIEHFIWDAFQNEPRLRPFNLNFLQLQNVCTHLHLHCAPRYREPRILDGLQWHDPQPAMPVKWSTEPVPHNVLQSVHALLAGAFRRQLAHPFDRTGKSTDERLPGEPRKGDSAKPGETKS